MAKFQSPLLGYNNNVRHKNRVFHIQTEDSGVNHPHIITHLFMDGGRILKSVKKSYAEHVGAEGMSETVRGLMKEQHKAMFIALRDGQFDHIVDPNAAAAKAKADADASAKAEAGAAAAAEPSVPDLAAVADAAVEVAAGRAGGDPPTNPEPPRVDVELSPNTIDESRRRSASNHPAPVEAASASSASASARVSVRPEDAPMTTRQPPDARPEHIPTGRELTLDFDALERAAQDAIVGPAASLFHSNDLPPPPKNMFAAKEPGTGGAYRAVEADPRHDARADGHEEPAPRSGRGDARSERSVPRSDPREEASPRSSRSPGSSAAAVAAAAAAANNARNEKQPVRPSTRAPASRPGGDARYAPARPAAIFGSTQRPPPASLFSDELISDKSLDEVILSYLAEDLEPPRRK